MLKSEVGPSSPKAIPVFDKIPAAAVKVVVISRLSRESTKAVNRYISRYSIANTVIDETVSALTTLLPSLTATTDLGCNLFRKPLNMSLRSTTKRMTLKEPQVEAAQPPMTIKVKSMA